MVEQDTGAAEHTVGFVILFCNHKAILHVYCIRIVGVKMCFLILRNLFNFVVQFRSRGPAGDGGEGVWESYQTGWNFIVNQQVF